MANITAADVKKLRDLTAAGMMECKKALEETDGDFDLAVEHLPACGSLLRHRTSAAYGVGSNGLDCCMGAGCRSYGRTIRYLCI